MNCKTARLGFSLRLDGGLSYEETRAFQDHLRCCPACTREYAAFQRTVDFVRSLPEVPAPPTFVQDVVRAARMAQSADKPALPRVSWLQQMGDRLGGFAWIGSPRFAVAAASLGLILGVGGSMLLFRAPASTAERGERAPATNLARAIGEPSIEGSAGSLNPSERSTAGATAPPSGPFEDLVQQMLVRAETSQDAAAVDSLPQQELDWGLSPDAGSMGRQVNAPKSSGQARAGRVSRVF